jgi:hypothetical protein
MRSYDAGQSKSGQFRPGMKSSNTVGVPSLEQANTIRALSNYRLRVLVVVRRLSDKCELSRSSLNVTCSLFAPISR